MPTDHKKTHHVEDVDIQVVYSEKEMNKFSFKTRMFFAKAMLFIVVLSIIFPVQTNSFIINLLQLISWVFLIRVAYLSIKNIGGIYKTLTPTTFNSLSLKERDIMWKLFYAGFAIQLLARIFGLFI